MAIYHLSIKTISRSAGRSAVAAAAYRSGEKLVDERQGIEHDYTRKSGVVLSQIILPPSAPEWAADRAALWNAAEEAEKRKNSTVAREFEVALPSELDEAQRRELALIFCRELSDRHGVAVDLSIHSPGQDGDTRNHHAHVLVTTRRLGPEGLGEKTRELDTKNSGEVDYWRNRWAEICNECLEKAHQIERVDHRSLKDQGEERPAMIHQGPAVTQIERKAQKRAEKNNTPYEPITEIGKKNALIKLAASVYPEIEKRWKDLSGKAHRAVGLLKKIKGEISERQAIKVREEQALKREEQKLKEDIKRSAAEQRKREEERRLTRGPRIGR